MAQIQVALFLLLCMKVIVEARYVLEIRAHTYQNSESRDSDGVCCESLIPPCLADCDNIFNFCLRNAGMARDDDPQNCPLGRFNTVDDVGGDNIIFSSINIATGVPNPMTFRGDIWPGQVQFYIEVTDEDPNDDDHVDDIYVDISLSPSASFSPVMPYNGVHGNGRIELSFRVQCEASFFGEDCARFCQPTDNSTGHFTCGPNGEIICLQGWQDTTTNCLISVCSSTCSPVGGFCTRPGECLCHSGWNGTNCDQPVCSTTCSPIGGFCTRPGECQCHSGWSGTNCDQCRPRDGCSLEGGFCNLPGECNCRSGYSGFNCDININGDNCASSPCVRGTCIDLRNDFQCDCPEGFRGRTCQDSIINGNSEANTAAIVGGGVGAGVVVIALLIIVIILFVTLYVCAKGRKKESNNRKSSFPPPPPNGTSLNPLYAYGAQTNNTSSSVSPNLAYGADYSKLSGGTRPNLAYGAGSTWLQGTNNDAVYEEAGTYTGGPYVHMVPAKTTDQYKHPNVNTDSTYMYATSNYSTASTIQ